ncbi:DUF1549 and DUF1553 domain-containing protein [Pendulispora rubella]|uniref:DUF1549 and DUF1553 domain-containing protein n=1 Tax=Pendulispora rubella TaxID=2741070 RepID=A0ABZ2L995_9BACT
MKRTGWLVGVVVAAAGCAASGPLARGPAAASKPVEAPRPVLMRSAEIDARMRAAWKEKGLEPAERVDDAGFFRRVNLDLTGRVPKAEAVDAFLADKAEDKRAKTIDALLASPEYAEHFTNYWDRVLMGRNVRKHVDHAEFRRWLHEQLEKNVGYDVWVRELVSATGLTSAPRMAEQPVNGAANWYLRYMDNPPDLAGTTSRLFLGVRIQCAQCHDHKTEKWTMSDFQGFTASFLRTRAQLFYTDDKDKKGLRAYDVEDLERSPEGRLTRPRRAAKRMDIAEYKSAAPRALDGTDLLSGGSKPRTALAEWITRKDNPWFARAIVNRVWGVMLGRGFSEPVDDLRESNPPAMKDLLDTLASDFVTSGYDLKHLLRLIANAESYQLAARPKGQRGDGALWSYFHMDQLGPDELLDSLVRATGLPREKVERQFTFLFDVDEEDDHDDEFDGTITQALWLMNGKVMQRSIQIAPGSALAQVLSKPGGDEGKIRALYMRTLSRPPTDAETAHWVGFLKPPRPGPPPAGEGADTVRRRYEDLLWVLLNSSEFLFNH